MTDVIKSATNHGKLNKDTLGAPFDIHAVVPHFITCYKGSGYYGLYLTAEAIAELQRQNYSPDRQKRIDAGLPVPTPIDYCEAALMVEKKPWWIRLRVWLRRWWLSHYSPFR